MNLGISDGVLAVLTAHVGITILVKTTILLGLAGLLTFFVRRASAAVRSAVWCAAFGMILLLPVLSGVLPPLRVEQPVRSRPVLLRSVVPVAAQAADVESASSWTDVVRTEKVVRSDLIGALQRRTVTSAALVIWAGGVLLLLGRLLVHAMRVGRIARRAAACTDADVRPIVAASSADLGIRRQVRVLMSEEVTMPFCWGLLRPTIVLPFTVTEWPPEQKRSVLLHELAHVTRLDYPLHLLIEVVRAIYWPNPVIWLAARRAAMERERACDDIALSGGTPSDKYANHLLYIARLQVEGVPMGATSMAGEPGLLERVRSVMDRRLNRSPIGWGGVLLTGLLALLVTGPVATAWTTETWRVPTVEAMIDELQSDGNPLVRRRAAWGLGERESCAAVAPLVAALEDPVGDVRLVACWALGEIKDAAGVERLIRTLETDEDPLVREAAALALGEIGHPSPVGALAAAVDREEGFREVIVWALGEILDDSASKAREEVFAAWQREPWPHAQVWIGGLETEDVFSTDVGAVIMKLHAADADLRRRAACNLGMLGMLDLWESWDEVDVAVDHLLDSLRDPEPCVRAMAVWSLDEINPSRSIRDWRRPLVESALNEHRLNTLGYYLLTNGMTEQAVELFRANVRLNPWSANCYDSLGEGYMNAGKTELAILNYERSLELDPGNTNAVRMLNELLGMEQPSDGTTHEAWH